MYYYYYYYGGNIFETPENYDIDYFYSDNEKLIHIASGGVAPVGILTEINPENYLALKNIERLRRRFNISENDSIERDNLTSLEDYKSFFNMIATRGFYSYDKVNIDDPECYKFQLIANPIYNRNIKINNKVIHNLNEPNTLDKTWNYDFNFKSVKRNFPINHDIFDIREYIL